MRAGEIRVRGGSLPVRPGELQRARVSGGEVDAGAIKPDVAYHLTQVHDPADQAALAARVVAEGLSRAETVEAVMQAAGRPRVSSSKGRGVKSRKVTEWAFKTEGGTRVTLENRKGLD